jgi:predicted MFS family arabinose efflux permease
VALPTLAHGPFAAGASGYGLFLAAFGVGAFAGGLSGGSVGSFKHRGAIMLVLLLIMASCYPLVPFLGGMSGALVMLGLAGIANGLLNVLFFVVTQQLTPRHLLGRVMSVLMLANLGVYPLSVAPGGVIINLSFNRWSCRSIIPWFCRKLWSSELEEREDYLRFWDFASLAVLMRKHSFAEKLQI